MSCNMMSKIRTVYPMEMTQNPARQNLLDQRADRQDVQHPHTSNVYWRRSVGMGPSQPGLVKNSNHQDSNPRYQVSAHFDTDHFECRFKRELERPLRHSVRRRRIRDEDPAFVCAALLTAKRRLGREVIRAKVEHASAPLLSSFFKERHQKKGGNVSFLEQVFFKGSQTYLNGRHNHASSKRTNTEGND